MVLIKEDQNLAPSFDEIDVKQTISHLWVGKWYIVLVTLISICFASLYLNNVERKYTVIYNLAPVTSNDANPSLRGLTGLASLAGVSPPSNTNNDFVTFMFLLTSEEVAEALLQDSNLTKAIFRNEWSEQNNKFQAPARSQFSLFARPIKNFLTGDKTFEYRAPNAARLVVWMKKNIEIAEDEETGFLRLKSETSNPDLMIDLMSMASRITDDLMKERYKTRSEKIMTYYNQQLFKAKAREHREALATLIAQEDQKLILASREQHFIGAPVTIPNVSIYPTSPRSMLILALSLVLGGFLGSAFVLVRKAFSK